MEIIDDFKHKQMVGWLGCLTPRQQIHEDPRANCISPSHWQHASEFTESVLNKCIK